MQQHRTTIRSICQRMLVVAMLIAGVSHAAPSIAAEDAPQTKPASVTLDQVITRLKKARPQAEILKARTLQRADKRMHIVKFLTPHGHVRILRVNAQTGERL